jgi:hypothetical protein
VGARALNGRFRPRAGTRIAKHTIGGTLDRHSRTGAFLLMPLSVNLLDGVSVGLHERRKSKWAVRSVRTW